MADEVSFNTKKRKLSDQEQFIEHDCSELLYIKDDRHRPIWICDDFTIFFEAFSNQYKEICDFLTSIATPLSRTKYIHQYKIDTTSLYASISLGFNTEDILSNLQRFSKVIIPDNVRDFIIECGSRFGKVKLVLKRLGYYIESDQKSVLEKLLDDQDIKQLLSSDITERVEEIIVDSIGFNTEIDDSDIESELRIELLDDGDEQRSTPTSIKKTVYSIHLNSDNESVKRRCVELGYPLLEEYDYMKHKGQEINISLKQQTKLRKYQQQCLSKIFSNGRMKSGIISLACGAGKSLVGVTACSTLKKRTVVLCTSAISVDQWCAQFKLWSNINPLEIVSFTANSKYRITNSEDLGSILVTTYAMISNVSKRSNYSNSVIKLIEKEEWGLTILDEVHVVPANTFRLLTSRIKSHSKLGLSATLVREDDMIDHLVYLIGPKLFEANWLDLRKSGHIADVLCTEVLCEMTEEFFQQYLISDSKIKKVLFNANPNKIKSCEYLVKLHQQKKDKILIFSDDIFCLKLFSELLDIPYIYGGTPNNERVKLFNRFQFDSNMNVLMVSKIGDYSINLPEANVLIQISSHYGSRRQEAQRLGRILRPKNRFINHGNYDAFFYTLVSQDTKEIHYANKRRQFLIDQGYSFNIMSNLHDSSNLHSMQSLQDQKDLLQRIVHSNTEQLIEEEDVDMLMEKVCNHESNAIEPIEYTYTRRENPSLVSYSGADDFRYIEIENDL